MPIPVYLLAGVPRGSGRCFAQRTIWGQEIYAIGANPVAARLSGIPVARRLLLVYAVSGTMAGLASIIFLRGSIRPRPTSANRLTLPAIAAVLIGGTSLFGGVGTVFGTFIGALILTLVLNGMNLLVGQRQLAAAGHRHHRHSRGLARHEDPPPRAMSS